MGLLQSRLCPGCAPQRQGRLPPRCRLRLTQASFVCNPFVCAGNGRADLPHGARHVRRGHPLPRRNLCWADDQGGAGEGGQRQLASNQAGCIHASIQAGRQAGSRQRRRTCAPATTAHSPPSLSRPLSALLPHPPFPGAAAGQAAGAQRALRRPGVPVADGAAAERPAGKPAGAVPRRGHQAGVERGPQPDGGPCSKRLPWQLRQGRGHPQSGGCDWSQGVPRWHQPEGRTGAVEWGGQGGAPAAGSRGGSRETTAAAATAPCSALQLHVPVECSSLDVPPVPASHPCTLPTMALLWCRSSARAAACWG